MRIKLRKSQTTIEWEKVPRDIRQLEILSDQLEAIEDLERYQQLESLYLNCPALHHYPRLPHKLKILKIRASLIPRDWLASLSPLPHLTILQLSETCVEQLPDDFFDKTIHLTTLDLKGNRLTTLPSSLGQLERLARINLDHNRLEELPDFVFEMKLLHHLSLDGNPLSDQTKQKLYQKFGLWF